MKKTGYIIALVAVCVLTLGALTYFIINNNQASASYGDPTSTDLAIYKGSSYYTAKQVKRLLKPTNASSNVFVVSNNNIYPTDGVKREKSDTTVPAADQIKIELARGYFFLAYKDYPNSLSEVPENKRNEIYAFEGNLYYNSGAAVGNYQAVCTRGGKTYITAAYRSNWAACSGLTQGFGTRIDFRGTAKKIVTEKSQPQVDEE